MPKENGYEQLRDQFLLLKHIHDHLVTYESAEILLSQFVIFLMIKLQREIPHSLVKTLETQFGEILLRALQSSAHGLDQRLGLLESVRQNVLSEAEIKDLFAEQRRLEDIK